MPFFDKSGSHAFDHSERVCNLSLKIAEGEDVDLDVLRAAALLHDIARRKQGKGEVVCHAEDGSEMAKTILMETKFPKDKIEKVCHAITVHRYSKGLKAESKEAEILQDADRLDALGAITIARIFDYGGRMDRIIYDPKIKPTGYHHNKESNTSFNHFYEKILEIKPETFNTKKAQEIAKERYDYVKGYVERFLKEWNGEL